MDNETKEKLENMLFYMTKDDPCRDLEKLKIVVADIFKQHFCTYESLVEFIIDFMYDQGLPKTRHSKDITSELSDVVYIPPIMKVMELNTDSKLLMSKIYEVIFPAIYCRVSVSDEAMLRIRIDNIPLIHAVQSATHQIYRKLTGCIKDMYSSIHSGSPALIIESTIPDDVVIMNLNTLKRFREAGISVEGVLHGKNQYMYMYSGHP